MPVNVTFGNWPFQMDQDEVTRVGPDLTIGILTKNRNLDRGTDMHTGRMPWEELSEAGRGVWHTPFPGAFRRGLAMPR